MTLLPRLTGLCLKLEWALTKPELRSFFLRGLTPGSWLVEEPHEGPEVFLIADAIHDGFPLWPWHIHRRVPSCIPVHAGVMLVGGFCSVAADLQLRTRAYGPVTIDNATVPVAELLAVIFLVQRSVGPINIHSDCKYVCSGKNKLAQRTERGAHVTLRSRLQQALSRHQGTVKISWCKAHITSDNFHYFAMTPEILVRTMLWRMHSPRKEQACSLRCQYDWVKMDQITWAVQQRIYATSILAAQAAPRSVPVHAEDRSARSESENGNAPSWRMPPRTHWFLSAKGIIATCVKTLHQPLVHCIGSATPFAQDRRAIIHPIPCASGIRCYMSRIV